MAELTIDWPGQSGNTYRYYIVPMGTPLQAKPGNYIFAKQSKPGTWIPIYIGQTSDLDIRFDNHHKAASIKRNGATHIHQHLSGTERQRLDEETDLIRRWKPPSND